MAARASRRVLVSAYACEPGHGSEPGIGWNWVCQISRFHDTWVITRANNRVGIEQRLRQEPLPRANFIYYDLPRWMRFWKRGQRGFHLYYHLWQLGAYLKARRLHQSIAFDIVHHVTLGAYWKPSFLALLPIPFVWGPVGGGESTPASLRSIFGFSGRLREWLRDAAQACGRLDPFVRMTARRADLVLATTLETEEIVKALGSRRVAILSHAALPADEIRRLSALPTTRGGPFRVVSVGRLLHWKGYELGLRAFQRLHLDAPGSEYWILGDGPERRRLEKLASELGLSGAVVFRGAQPRKAVIELMAECDVLLHPSLHDSGAWVCVEAMAASRPVVCLDCGGPALIVTDETGFKIPASSPDQVVRDLAAALALLAVDPNRRRKIGAAARLRVEQHLNWDRKGEWLLDYTLPSKSPSEIVSSSARKS